jgi:hypothetical protein
VSCPQLISYKYQADKISQGNKDIDPEVCNDLAIPAGRFQSRGECIYRTIYLLLMTVVVMAMRL